MTELRRYVGTLSNEELWKIFSETELYEATGVVGPTDHLRLIAMRYMDNNVMAMHVVSHEVFRELAQRGAPHTMDKTWV